MEAVAQNIALNKHNDQMNQTLCFQVLGLVIFVSIYNTKFFANLTIEGILIQVKKLELQGGNIYIKRIGLLFEFIFEGTRLYTKTSYVQETYLVDGFSSYSGLVCEALLLDVLGLMLFVKGV